MLKLGLEVFGQMTFNSSMILGGDIGGTKVNLGLFEVEGQRVKLAAEGSYASRRFAHLQDIVRDFVAVKGAPEIEAACFGIAGPVKNGRVQVTNLPWVVEAVEMAEELKLESVSLLNDLESNGYGLAELESADLRVLNAGDPNAIGNAAIISAGTGLGEAGLFWDGQRHHPFACEGGHCDFAPLTKLDAELFEYMNGRFGHVSWEKVLSGAGLYNIYQFLRDTGRGDEPAGLAEALAQGDAAALISEAALKHESSRCVQALELFVTYYGAEAGNLALKVMATGGIYIGGGIAPKILARLQAGNFLEALFSKGRMRSLLEAIPVRVVLNPKTALLGAGHYAAFGAGSIASPVRG
ncbi:MAG: glk [Pedosphaera sp.]|nr:glk [Pedosphaera sp.]